MPLRERLGQGTSTTLSPQSGSQTQLAKIDSSPKQRASQASTVTVATDYAEQTSDSAAERDHQDDSDEDDEDEEHVGGYGKGRDSYLTGSSAWESDRSLSFEYRDDDSQQEITTGIKVAIYATVCILVSWFLIAAVLLLAASATYGGPTVDDDRQRYAVMSARRIGAEVAICLSQALMVRDTVAYAVNRKLYVEPLDYEAARLMLAPAFAAVPTLRAVDLAFTNRTTSLSLRRVLDGTGVDPGPKQGSAPVTLLLQSDANDCLQALGPLGCLRARPAHEQSWFAEGAELDGGGENPASMGSTTDTFRWLSVPFFVPREPPENIAEIRAAEKAQASARTEEQKGRWWENSDPLAAPAGYKMERRTVAWETAYSLVFRFPFPGTRGYLSVVGRVTLDLSAMRHMDRLVDTERLGQKGSLLVLDGGGHVLAAAGQSMQAMFERESGVLRPRKAWEFDAAWTRKMLPEDGGVVFRGGAGAGGGGGHSFDEAGFFVAVERLRGRGLTDFSVMVAAERHPFVDSFLDGMGGTAYTLLLLPVPGAALILGSYGLWELFKQRRKQSRVAPNDAGRSNVAQKPKRS